MRWLTVLLALLAFPAAAAESDDLGALLQGLNAARSEASVQPLQPDPTLTRISRDYALVMAELDCLAHDCDGGRAAERATAAGYAFLMIGEALAGGPDDAEAALELWMGSPLHRDILLNPDLSAVGLGYAYREADRGRAPYGHYWVVTVGLPQ